MNIYKLSSKKKKKDPDFDYSEEIKSMWQKLINKEKERVNIYFDLENDNSIDCKTIDLEYTDKNNNEYRVKSQMCMAGGDWEASVCYFRCQFEERYYIEQDNSWGQWRPSKKAIIIPIKGNINLEKQNKDKFCAIDADNGLSLKEKDEKILWDEMKRLSEERIKIYNDCRFNSYEDPDKKDQTYEKTGIVDSLLKFL